MNTNQLPGNKEIAVIFKDENRLCSQKCFHSLTLKESYLLYITDSCRASQWAQCPPYTYSRHGSIWHGADGYISLLWISLLWNFIIVKNTCVSHNNPCAGKRMGRHLNAAVFSYNFNIFSRWNLCPYVIHKFLYQRMKMTSYYYYNNNINYIQ